MPAQCRGFYGGMPPLMDKGRAVDIINLDFCVPFDMVPHNILLSELKRDGSNSILIDGEESCWMITSKG